MELGKSSLFYGVVIVGRRRPRVSLRSWQRAVGAVMAAVVASGHAQSGGGEVTEPKASKDTGGSYAQAAARVSCQEPAAVSNGLTDPVSSGPAQGLGLSSNMVRPGSCAQVAADAPRANPWVKRNAQAACSAAASRTTGEWTRTTARARAARA